MRSIRSKTHACSRPSSSCRRAISPTTLTLSECSQRSTASRSRARLTRRLKIYAVGGANQLLFGLPLPDLAADGPKPTKRGLLWLDYLTAARRQPGIRFSDAAKLPKKARAARAWGEHARGLRG